MRWYMLLVSTTFHAAYVVLFGGLLVHRSNEQGGRRDTEQLSAKYRRLETLTLIYNSHICIYGHQQIVISFWSFSQAPTASLRWNWCDWTKTMNWKTHKQEKELQSLVINTWRLTECLLSYRNIDQNSCVVQLSVLLLDWNVQNQSQEEIKVTFFFFLLTGMSPFSCGETKTYPSFYRRGYL